jgi:uncharacterized coiled-coil protein SlyX
MTKLEELEARIEHLEKMQTRIVKNVTFTQQAIEKLTKIIDRMYEFVYAGGDTYTKEDENEQTH